MMAGLCLACSSVILSPGCNSRSDTSAGTDPQQAGLRIAVIPKGTSHEFWKSVHFGAVKAAQEIGNVEIIYRGPVVESDTGSQIEVVKNMITMGVDGICLAPNQKGGLVDAVEEAIASGIPVVIFDSGLDEGPEIVSYVATDNFKGGQLAAKQMAAAIGGRGNVILLRYMAGSESTEQREEGFLAGIKEFPDIVVVESNQYGGDNATKAKERVDQLLQIHGAELAGLFAVCEPNANGALEAIKNAGLDQQVKLIGFDSSASLVTALAEGTCGGIVLQDPIQMGYQSVMTMVRALQGEKQPAYQSTGEYVATPENAQEPEIQELLKPEILE
jgi:ribose transport system substrate-binding protein